MPAEITRFPGVDAESTAGDSAKIDQVDVFMAGRDLLEQDADRSVENGYFAPGSPLTEQPSAAMVQT